MGRHTCYLGLWVGKFVALVQVSVSAWVHMGWSHIKVYWGVSGSWVHGCVWYLVHRCQPSTGTGLESGSLVASLEPEAGLEPEFIGVGLEPGSILVTWCWDRLHLGLWKLTWCEPGAKVHRRLAGSKVGLEVKSACVSLISRTAGVSWNMGLKGSIWC